MKHADPFQRELRARVAAPHADRFPLIVAAPPGSGKTFAAIHASRGQARTLLLAPSRGVAHHFAAECDAEGEAYVLAQEKAELPATWDGILVATKHAVFAAFQQSFGRTQAGHHRLRPEGDRHAFIQFLRATTLDLLVVDEVHHFSGAETLHNAALRFLSSRSRIRVGMSGTPVTNRPEDMATVLRGLGLPGSHPMADPFVWAPRPGVLSAKTLTFFSKHCLIRGAAPALVPADVEHVRVSPHLDAAARRRYNDAVGTAKKTKQSSELMAAFQTLLRIAVDAKLETAAAMLASTREPVVVVSPLCEPLTQLSGPKSVLYTGQISPKKRQEHLERFLRGEADVFLLSLKAGSEGLDGLQTRACRMFILAPPWTHAALTQTIARLQRRGQTRPVRVSLLIVTATIDDALLGLISSKKRGMEALLAESHTSEEVAWRVGRGLRAALTEL